MIHRSVFPFSVSGISLKIPEICQMWGLRCKSSKGQGSDVRNIVNPANIRDLSVACAFGELYALIKMNHKVYYSTSAAVHKKFVKNWSRALWPQTTAKVPPKRGRSRKKIRSILTFRVLLIKNFWSNSWLLFLCKKVKTFCTDFFRIIKAL